MKIEDILVMCFLTEAIWQGIKALWPVQHLQWLEKTKQIPMDFIGAFLTALVICVGYGADLPAAMGFTSKVSYLGVVLTAAVIYRGSGVVHEIFAGLHALRTKGTLGGGSVG